MNQRDELEVMDRQAKPFNRAARFRDSVERRMFHVERQMSQVNPQSTLNPQGLPRRSNPKKHNGVWKAL